MKKLIAVLLLSIHLCTIGGHVVLHQYFAFLSDRFYNEQISKGLYNTNDLKEIRIPVNLPGITDWKAYENVTGSIQFENASYNYVKMRMTRNIMYLMCVPNYKTTHLSVQNVIYAKRIKDVQIPKKEHVPFGKTNFVVYNYHATYYKFSTPVTTARKTVYNTSSIIPSFFITGPGQPPDSKAIIS